MNFMLGVVQTRLRFDNGPAVTWPWGTSLWWLPPGEHLVECSFPWGFYKQAGLRTVTVDLRHTQVLHLDYEAPRWFLGGKGTWTVGSYRTAPPVPAALDHAALPPTGWYADPAGDGQQRFWDGGQWTDHVRPAG